MFCLQLGFYQIVFGQCFASFSADSVVCFNDTAHFSFTGVGTTLYWDFDDPASSQNSDTIENPSHFFTRNGIFNVRLIVSDSNCSDTIFKQITVLKNLEVSFDFTNNCSRLQTLFLPTFSIDSLDSIAQVRWFIDTIFVDSALILNYLFQDSGWQVVSLYIETDNNCKSHFSDSIFIYPIPKVSIDKNIHCRARDIKFRFVDSGYTTRNYRWDFNDGSSSSLKEPSYQYNDTGIFYPSVSFEFNDSSQCLFFTDSIFITAPPISDFRLISDTVQCFKNNEICIEFLGRESNLFNRTVIWGDGFLNDDMSLNDSSICHHYADSQGGIYGITIEIIDSIGCNSTTAIDSLVKIHRDFQIDFVSPDTVGCFSTQVSFDVQSNKPFSQIDSLSWDLGDGTIIDSIFSFNHIYTTDGIFDIVLWAKDSLGCIDTTSKTGSIRNVFFEIDAKIDSANSSFCFRRNNISFVQTPYPGATIRWDWSDLRDTSNSWTPSKYFWYSGDYTTQVSMRYRNCVLEKELDTLSIIGPRARLARIDNRYQCEITDTVYFTNGTLFDGNKSRSMFWDFADPFAPACTTNYSKGINVDSNCRYSTDSMFTKHWYTPGTERCFTPYIIASDSVSGCADTLFFGVPLMKPKASPDFTIIPQRQGLILNRKQTCLGTNEDYGLIVNLQRTEPSCLRESWWIMWDSLKAAQSGNFDSYWQKGRNHWTDTQYYDFSDRPMDKDGFVSIGLVIQNGSDSSGNVCRDTAWYHHFLQFEMYDPEFVTDYDSNQYYCSKSILKFRIKDTLQDQLESVTWDWGDGSSFVVTDSFFNEIEKRYDLGGIYNVRLTAITKKGCVGSYQKIIKVGYTANYLQSLNAPFQNICKGAEIPIHINIRYAADNINYWFDSTRAYQGKETIRFDFGDSLGYQKLFYPFKHKFEKSGIFNVSMEIIDSAGCKDTFALPNYTVKYIDGDIILNQDTFVCAQIIRFNSSFTQYDSSSSFVQDTNGAVSYRWNFGPRVRENIAPSPSLYFMEGDYETRLIVQNNIGCKDTAYKSFVVDGPIAKFSILSDSVGCQTLPILFQNESYGASSFLWRFNDGNGSVRNTSSKTDFIFPYVNHGTFYPSLIATGNYIRNGIPITCTSIFPDSNTIGFREITVFEKPRPNFTHVTNCATSTTTFRNRSVVDSTTITSVFWDFGDGNTSSDYSPSHQYSDTGRYLVKLICFSADGCVDSIQRMIMISPSPIPRFSFNNDCALTSIPFKDSTLSFNDVIVNWRWDFGDTTFSNSKNPNKVYASGGKYNVRLRVRNSAGCFATLVQTINVHHTPNVDFDNQFNCTNFDIALNNLSSTQDTTFKSHWVFSPSLTSNELNPKLTYTIDGDKNIKLVVTSDFGCKDSIIKTLKINATPIANFTVNDSLQCFKGNEYQFMAVSSVVNDSLTNHWNFGDAVESQLFSPIHSYSDTGTYIVTLITTSSNNCADTISKGVVVKPNPTADFTINQIQQCLRFNQYEFTDVSTISDPSQTYALWYIEAFSNNSDSTVKYQFSDTGFYNIQLISISDHNCRDTTEKTVEVIPMPVARIDINTQNQCVNEQNYVFTDSTTLAKYPSWSVHWDLGNGTQSTQSQTTTSYPDTGFYVLTLSVMSDLGCTDTTTAVIEIYPKPTLDFEINNDKQCQYDDEFIFTNKTFVEKGTLSYFWDLGDATISSSKDVSHRYDVSDTLSVSLWAQSSLGCRDSIEKQVIIYPKPKSIIIIIDSQQCINTNAFVFSSGSEGFNTDFELFTWNIPLINLQSEQPTDTFKYTFDNYGIYPIELIVKTVFNCVDTSFSEVEVFPKPTVNFAINDSGQCVNNQEFIFTNESNLVYGQVTYYWDFGDGNSLMDTNAVHQYLDSDTFDVSLLAISGEDCKDSVSKIVVVYPKPEVNFAINDTAQCLAGNLFQLDNLSQITYSNLTYLWKLDSVRTSTNKDTSVSYNKEGNYPIELITTSEYLCKDSITKTVIIHPKPIPEFSINKEKQCLNDNAFNFTNLSSIAYGDLHYRWLIDGQLFDSTNTEYIFSKIGNNNIKLYVISGWNCIDSIEKVVRVWANPNANFTINIPTQCVNNQNFEFNDISTIDEGVNQSRQWFTNQVIFSNIEKATYHYPRSGFYSVKLIVISDSGCVDSTSQNITIYPKPKASFDINDTAQCLYTNLFEFSSTSKDTLGLKDYFWTIGQDKNGTTPVVNHKFNKVGYHTIILEINSTLGCRDTTTREIYVKPMPDPSFEKLKDYYCNNTGPFSFNPNTEGGTFYGKNIEQNLYYPEILWDDTIEHKVTVNGCLDSSTQYTKVYPAPEIFLGNDTTLCKFEVLNLNAEFWNSTYLWNDNSTKSNLLAFQPGRYSVIVRNICGIDSSAIEILYRDYNCRIFLPNAFTPDDDGLNDVYKPITRDVLSYHWQVYNRWGELIYEGRDNDFGWDGTYRGQPAQAGVYLIQISYSFEVGGIKKHLYDKGTIHLMR